MEESTPLARPLVLGRMSVPDLARLHRQLYHLCLETGRLVAGFAPSADPGATRGAMVETVFSLVERAADFLARSEELGLRFEDASACPDEVREAVASACGLGRAEVVFAWIARRVLPGLRDLCEEALIHGEGIEFHRDRLAFQTASRDLSTRIAQCEDLDLPPAPSSPEVPLDLLPQTPSRRTSPAGCEPLTIPATGLRYPKAARLTEGTTDRPGLSGSREDMGAFLHANLQIEWIACCVALRHLSDFHQMPLGFYRDMARHAHDEHRHLLMLDEHLGRLGVGIADRPFQVPDKYDVIMKGDLPTRLVLLSRTGESEAIEMGAHMEELAREAGMEDLARMFSHVVSDEIRHTAYANHWLRELVGDDDDAIQRATGDAIRMYNEAAAEIGLRKGPRDPDYLSSPRPFGVESRGRRLAGFTEAEIAALEGATAKHARRE